MIPDNFDLFLNSSINTFLADNLTNLQVSGTDNVNTFDRVDVRIVNIRYTESSSSFFVNLTINLSINSTKNDSDLYKINKQIAQCVSVLSQPIPILDQTRTQLGCLTGVDRIDTNYLGQIDPANSNLLLAIVERDFKMLN